MINFEKECDSCGKFVQNNRVYRCPVCGRLLCDNCCPTAYCPFCDRPVVTGDRQIGWQYRE
jgi:hypothetical protein